MSPAVFNDLPVDILPLIIGHIVKTHHLAVACRVNKTFLEFTLPCLYESVYIYAWHRQAKVKITQLFTTLSRRPDLASYIRRIGCICFVHPKQCAYRFPATPLSEMRDFPKGLLAGEKEDLIETCVRGISHCANLRSCTWTRDGSLTTALLRSLVTATHLQDLSINGHDEGHYDPALLLCFTTLRKLTIIMPSAQVVSLLPGWLGVIRSTLSHLSIICKASPRLTDTLLSHCAPYLAGLEVLHLAGCSKITHEGIIDILYHALKIKELGLEGLSSAFCISDLTTSCARHNSLATLTSITLTLPLHEDVDRWFDQVLTLLGFCPLQEFQLYTLGGDLDGKRHLKESFVRNLVYQHGSRLRKFSIQRLHTSLTAIGYICEGCAFLEQLYIVVCERNLEQLGSHFRKAKCLRKLHVSFPHDAGLYNDDDRLVLSQEEILYLIQQCGPRLREFGVSNRVWLLERVACQEADGVATRLHLSPYENPENPEQFLIVQA